MGFENKSQLEPLLIKNNFKNYTGNIISKKRYYIPSDLQDKKIKIKYKSKN